MSTFPTVASVSLDDFRADPHAARYVRVLEDQPAATAALFAILDDPASLADMVGAERLDHPALSGIVGRIESHPSIRTLLERGSDGLRFRQAVGVAVRLVMERAGWHTTREKGPVRGAGAFKRAEHYRPPSQQERRARAAAAREAIMQIGTDDERRRTGAALMAGLRSTREAEGRVL